jgi:hypothetical protein
VLLNKFQFNNLGLTVANGKITFPEGGWFQVRASLPSCDPTFFHGRLFSNTRQLVLINGSGGNSQNSLHSHSEVEGVIQVWPNEEVVFQIYTGRQVSRWVHSASQTEEVNSSVEISKFIW